MLVFAGAEAPEEVAAEETCPLRAGLPEAWEPRAPSCVAAARIEQQSCEMVSGSPLRCGAFACLQLTSQEVGATLVTSLEPPAFV